MARTHTVTVGNLPGSLLHGEQIDHLNLTNVGWEGAGSPTLTQNNEGVVNMDQTWLTAHEFTPGSKLIYRVQFNGGGFNMRGSTSPKGIEFRECRFVGSSGANGGSWFQMGVAGDFAPDDLDLKIRWCTFDATSVPSNSDYLDRAPIGHTGYTVERCIFSGSGNGPRATGGANVIMRENLIYNLRHNTANIDPHRSGTGVNACEVGPILIERNKVWPNFGPNATPDGLSGASVHYNQPLQRNVTYRNNCITGGGSYTLYFLAGDGANNVISGNIWYRIEHRFSSQFGPVSASGVGWTQFGNKWGPRGPFWQTGDPEEGDPLNF